MAEKILTANPATASSPGGGWRETSEFLSDQQLAEMLGVTTRTTLRWRRDGAGPKYVRAGPRRILYRRVDVLAWTEANTFITLGAETAFGQRLAQDATVSSSSAISEAQSSDALITAGKRDHPDVFGDAARHGERRRLL
jgi:predicted DNA-binding transcriptional regulator AlpA